MALMQQKAEGEKFKKPNLAQFTPPEAKDAVDRLAAAGVKMMYAPSMRDELQAAVESEEPVAKVMAENTAGLMLLLDQKSGGKTPVAAIFPAALELLAEAGEALVAAGKTVTQADYNESAQMIFVILSKKMGATDEQIMEVASKQIGGQPGAAPEAPPGAPQAMPPGPMPAPGAMPPQGAM